MSKYADVALPVGVDREFTYLIPSSLEGTVAVGVRVVVPFGRKFIAGLVVDLPPSSNVPGIKPIRDVLDALPVVSPRLMQLCRWIAEYYLAPLGEVLKAANPGTFARPSRRRVSLSSAPPEDSSPTSRKRASTRAAILNLLKDHGPLTSSQLERQAGIKNIHPVLNELERGGYVVTEEILPVARPVMQTKEFVLAGSVQVESLARRISTTPPRHVRLRELLAAVLRLREHGDIPVAEILKRSGASTRLFRSIAAEGLFATAHREVRRQQEYDIEEQTLNIVLNPEQESVRKAVTAAMVEGKPKVFLLHGVTGSGKTQVYIECIKHALAAGKSALVLVPEISLTPQIVRRFKSHFADSVAVVHSRMSTPERREVWRLAQRGECRIVIGPRSAIFAPVMNLGLIVVDEEHEASYKQFDPSPRYHARDIAAVRGSIESSVVVLGSATPSVESYTNAHTGKYTLLELPRRVDDVPMPSITLVDMTAERKRAYTALKESLPAESRGALKAYQQSTLSMLLQTKIQERLERHEGTILLQNRRGFAPFVECPECGHSETCENCNVTLTYHLTQKHLRCHYCGLVRQPYLLCPQCGGTQMKLQGIGTQKVEQELARILPHARVLRMDLDTTTRRGAHDRILKKFGERGADILLGTQMVAKGLDFPHVTLVGVISADTQMLLPDFRSAERTFQLLTQVAGRAGRSGLLGEVVIQTRQPAHYALAHVLDQNFKTFFQEELEQRRDLDYPPFSRLILIEAKGKDEERVREAAERFAGALTKNSGMFKLLGPAPAVLSKIKNQHRWHVLLKNDKTRDPSGQQVRDILERARTDFERKAPGEVRLIIDVDPVGML
jgi:primosomal protein N' (replication factor Y) (superfamily II helicase)